MISAKNYAAKAEAGIAKWAAAPANYEKREYDVFFCEMFIRLIKDAVHFAIPDNGEIFNDDLKGLVGLKARLPYPSITVEYFVDDSKSSHSEAAPIYSPRRLVLAIESDKNEILSHQAKMEITNGINAFGAFPDDEIIQIIVANEINGNWALCPMSWVMPSTWDYQFEGENVRQFDPLIPPKSKRRMAGTPIPILPGLFGALCEMRGVEQSFRECVHDVAGEVTAVLELCEALACSNVTAETMQHENKKANARRAKKGKLPIYETKVLSIDVQRTTHRTGVKYGDRSSPRQHLRRGHIRRLHDDRRIWVNSCAVGTQSLGRVDKNYRVFSSKER